MTEADWQTCSDPARMLDHFVAEPDDGTPRRVARYRIVRLPDRALVSDPAWSHTASERKLRLFACAGSRSLWTVMSEQGEDVFQGMEELASAEDDVSRPALLRNLAERITRAAEAGSPDLGRCGYCYRLMAKHEMAAARELVSSGKELLGHRADALLADLLRDLFGPLPFRPMRLDASLLGWHNGIIPNLARCIYDGRRFGDLPVLADCLEEAGCTDVDVLAHCRSRAEHALGCWAVDLILGKQ